MVDNRSIQEKQLTISKSWKILGIVILISALGGCISTESKSNAELTYDKISAGNFSNVQNESTNASIISEPKLNQVHAILRPKELNRTGRLPITLLITNPKLNETVLTVFKPEFGQEWYNQTSITYIANRNWTQNFSIKPLGNTSYVLMIVQISDNDTVVKRAAWNITLEAPVGRPK